MINKITILIENEIDTTAIILDGDEIKHFMNFIYYNVELNPEEGRLKGEIWEELKRQNEN